MEGCLEKSGGVVSHGGMSMEMSLMEEYPWKNICGMCVKESLMEECL